MTRPEFQSFQVMARGAFAASWEDGQEHPEEQPGVQFTHFIITD